MRIVVELSYHSSEIRRASIIRYAVGECSSSTFPRDKIMDKENDQDRRIFLNAIQKPVEKWLKNHKTSTISL